jgi:hypothetical protein
MDFQKLHIVGYLLDIAIRRGANLGTISICERPGFAGCSDHSELEDSERGVRSRQMIQG